MNDEPSSKLPALMFYVGDWRKDVGVQALDYQSRGIWFEILCLMHACEHRGVLTLNGAAMPEEALARSLGITVGLLKKTLTKIEAFGVSSREPGTGALMSRRMVRDEKTRQVKAACGKMGGNPALLKQRPNQAPTTGANQTPATQANQDPTPSDSASVSPSGNESQVGDGLPFGSQAFVGAWSVYENHLVGRKRPITAASRPLLLQELAAMGEERAIAAIKHTVARGWLGIREPDSTHENNKKRNGRSFEKRNDYTSLD